ncbi:hypothetical protein [Streptomyces sp. NPDC021622]|uniref:hypothetical protein n=1 Tax=Streptomyces sp. NPDC021622 TaxID=3155013 RepID=UPI0033E2CCE1
MEGEQASHTAANDEVLHGVCPGRVELLTIHPRYELGNHPALEVRIAGDLGKRAQAAFSARYLARPC